MNVLVYSGPETLQTSVSRTITALRSALYPHYTVQPVSLQSLTSQPWTTLCALLVIPACREHLSFSSAVSTSIRSYVENGGALLGLRAGCKIGGSLFSGGDYTLRFQSKTGPSIYCAFVSGQEDLGRKIAILAEDGETISGVVESGPVTFEGVDGNPAAKILARNAADETIVATQLNAGNGKLVLWGSNIEVPITGEDGASSSELRIAEERRRKILGRTLKFLGLELPTVSETAPSHPLPQFLVSLPSKPDIVPSIVTSLSAQPGSIFKDSNDTFAFHSSSEAETLLQEARLAANRDDTRHVVIYENGALPPTALTPLFNVQQYFEDLAAARSTETVSMVDQWGIGEAFIYGEAVTSTQTLLDK